MDIDAGRLLRTVGQPLARDVDVGDDLGDSEAMSPSVGGSFRFGWSTWDVDANCYGQRFRCRFFPSHRSRIDSSGSCDERSGREWRLQELSYGRGRS